MDIILNVLRTVFTIADVAFLYVLARYLISERSGVMARVLIGDLDHESEFYQRNKQLLTPKIRQVYFANFIFITLFTLCLWANTFAFQISLAVISLIAFISLMIVERNYQKVLKQLGNELKRLNLNRRS